MTDTSQQRALANNRRRLNDRGMARFEVLGLDADRGLIRSLAKRLARNDEEAARLRGAVSPPGEEVSRRGGILAALRRSPLVGADVELRRARAPGRKLDL